MTELRIQEVCKEKGITMQELAKRMGKTYQALYASIGNNPTLSRLDEIAEILGVSTVDLFERKKEIKILLEHQGEIKQITEMDLLEIFKKK